MYTRMKYIEGKDTCELLWAIKTLALLVEYCSLNHFTPILQFGI